MTYTPSSTPQRKIHYILAHNRDMIVVVTNPEPSVADPAHLVQTVVSTFNVVDEGPLGATIVPSKMPPQTYGETASTERELRDVHTRMIEASRKSL